MRRECEGNQHVFWQVKPETWGSGNLDITVDSDGECRCWCGKFTLVQPASSMPLCESCSHPEKTHLHGWCYGPTDFDADDCNCQQFIAKPARVPGPRKITL